MKEQKLQAAQGRQDFEEEYQDNRSEASQEYSFDEDDDRKENVQEEEVQGWEFPQMIGRIPEYRNAVLELIKVNKKLHKILSYIVFESCSEPG